MRIAILTLCAALAWAAPALADDEEARGVFGGDRFIAGQDVATEAATEGDLFMAGEKVAVENDVAGSAHVAGREVRLTAPIGGAVYAAGYAVEIDAPVGGNASLMGAEITVSAPVAGNLRAAGSEVVVEADVGGAALLGGEDVTLNAAVAGDMAIGAEDITWGPEARVDGALTVYAEDPEGVSVPERVAAADRVTVRDASQFEEWEGPGFEPRGPSTRAVLGGFLMSVLTVAALAALAVGVAPLTVAEWRRRALARPVASVGLGFLALSTIAGAGIVLGLTLIGLLLLPAAIFLAGFAGLAGYVLGSYILGVGLWMAIGNPEPTAFGQKVGMAALGAFVAGVALLIPLLGWLFALGLSWLGLGAIAGKLLERRNTVAY
jgi:hypothetical protein